MLAVIYLVLICYTGVHHGYWNSLVQPLGFGSTCALTSDAFDDHVLLRTFCPIPPNMSMFVSLLSYAQQSARALPIFDS